MRAFMALERDERFGRYRPPFLDKNEDKGTIF